MAALSSELEAPLLRELDWLEGSGPETETASALGTGVPELALLVDR